MTCRHIRDLTQNHAIERRDRSAVRHELELRGIKNFRRLQAEANNRDWLDGGDDRAPRVFDAPELYGAPPARLSVGVAVAWAFTVGAAVGILIDGWLRG